MGFSHNIPYLFLIEVILNGKRTIEAHHLLKAVCVPYLFNGMKK